MTRFVALVGLSAGQLGLMLANYYFTFGLWPKSWFSFFACGVGSVVLIGIHVVMQAEQK